MRSYVALYYWTLRSTIKEHIHLKPLLTSCKHCGILFINHPCNAGRDDISCPFGCRDEHRRRSSSKRSTQYYQTREGKIKKKQLNSRRKNNNNVNNKQNQDSSRPKKSEKPLIKVTHLSHIQLLMSLIEGQHINIDTILEMLSDLRQHSLVFFQKKLYKHFYNQKSPP